jgi:predicted transcriptional regulator
MLGLPGSIENKEHLLTPHRKLIESLIENNPQISNSAILEHLPIKVNQCTIADYRHRLGLPCNPRPTSFLPACRDQIEQLIKDNPKISNRQILKLLPIKIDNTTLAKYRHQLGLPVNLPFQDSGIKQYREQIEQLVRENPTITNQQIIEQLTLPQISTTTLGKYRHRWGLSVNPDPPDINLEQYREQIEQFVKENPSASNREVIEQLSLTGISPHTLGWHRRKWGLPTNSVSRPDMEQYHEQIEQLVRANPKITNTEIIEQLSLTGITESIVSKFRHLWGLPCNVPIASNLQEYRAIIERLIQNNPAISNREIIERLPIDTSPANLYYFRRKWGLPRNTIDRKSESFLDVYRKQIKQLIVNDPYISHREIRNCLSIKVSLTTIAEYRKKNGWSRSKIRKPEAIQRTETTPHPNTIDDIKLPDRESPPQIPFDTLVRDFWSDESRAVDVLMLPPGLCSVITENVEQALVYAWQTLKST